MSTQILLQEKLNIGKIAWRPGLRHGPSWGSLQCSPDFRAGGEGAGPQNPTPGPFGPSGLSSTAHDTRNSSWDEIANANFFMTSYTYYEIQARSLANYCVSVYLT